MKIIHLVCAARPNFMKIAPLWHQLKDATWCKPLIVHTGQHYDRLMSDSFFIDFNLPAPHISLGIGSGSHAEQTGKTMIAYEKVCIEQRPDLTIVVGDVNATAACALVCAKLEIPLVHLEAGLRSFDRSMPEEINRIVTDSLSDLCLTPSEDGNENLRNEGVAERKIQFVGNIMIDTLKMLMPVLERQKPVVDLSKYKNGYAILTLHRPSNVDEKAKFAEIIESIGEVSSKLAVIFPVHPRTKKNLIDFRLYFALEQNDNIKLLDPLSYNQFMRLVLDAKAVITDSGGIQEETSYLGIPCLTLRDNTERPVTITLGTNRLVKARELAQMVEKIVVNNGRDSRRSTREKCAIPLWDGNCAKRVFAEIANFIK